LPLFSALVEPETRDPLRDALGELDVDALSPREALDALYRIKGIAGEG
jgi:DNA mismatch repair protein MutS